MADVITRVPAGGSVGVPSGNRLFAYKAEADGQDIDLVVNGATRRLGPGDVTDTPVDPGARMRIYNPNNKFVDLRYFVGDDMYRTAKLAGTVKVASGDIVVSGAVEVTNWAAPTVVGSGVKTVNDGTFWTVPANNSRRNVTIQSLPENTGTMRVADSNAAVMFYITPNGTATIDTTDTIRIYNYTGSSQEIAFMELIG